MHNYESTMVHGQRARPPYNLQVVLRRSWWSTKCILWSCTKTPEMSNFLHFAKRFVDIVADMRLSAAYLWYLGNSSLYPPQSPQLASLTPSTPGFSLTSLVAINLFMLTGNHKTTPTVSMHLWCSPGISPGASAFLYIPYLLSDIVRSFNVQHRQYADDTNTMPIFISLSSTGYSADISNLTHPSLHSWFCLIAWF